ncbi:MAG TPA: hypothetical protein VJG90_01825 [Candidatus Nanoarchaeia archaeon]|nr:hypothetical protein [Candidatus Nanoarchaeia archaeon]
MKKITTLLLFVLIIGVVEASHVTSNNSVVHRSKMFGSFGSQIIKTYGGGSSIKKVWDLRKAPPLKPSEETTKPETPKYQSFGIQPVYSSSPYAQGNFGTTIRDYGFSKQAFKRFVRKPVEVPIPQPEARVTADSVVSEPPAPEEPVSEPSTT